jgi:TfoX/Sxy family transcriptional regulator of competence genes
MAYDQDLADRIRELVGGDAGVTEQRMFGGLAFLVGGNMAVAASGQGGLMVRVDPAQSDRLVATTTATPMVMRGRPMAGWLRIPSDDVRTKRQLSKWVTIGTSYAGSLPPKSGSARSQAARLSSELAATASQRRSPTGPIRETSEPMKTAAARRPPT